MAMGVELVGEQDLLTRLAHAQAGLLDLTDVNRGMVALVDREAERQTPVGATHKLSHSNSPTATATGWTISNGQPYAPPVHWGTRIMRARPWLLAAGRATEDQWMDKLTDHVQQLLDN